MGPIKPMTRLRETKVSSRTPTTRNKNGGPGE